MTDRIERWRTLGDALRALRAIWPLQVAFDQYAHDQPEAALRELERPCFQAFRRFPLIESAIQYRVLLLALKLETGRHQAVGRLLNDIRASRSFNPDERALLLKYVLTAIWHSSARPKASWLQLADQIEVNGSRVHPTLMSRYGGCIRYLDDLTAVNAA